MDRRDESIVWDQYAPSVATDGSFLTHQPDPAFQKLSGRESRWLLESSRRRLSGLHVPRLTPAKKTEFKLAV